MDKGVWEKAGALLLLAGLALWLIFLMCTRVTFGDMGLIDTIGTLFYLATGLMILAIVAFVMADRVGYLCLISIASLFAALYSLPWLIEGTPYFSAVFRVLGYTNFIIDIGIFNQAAMSYQNWPGIMIVGTFIKSAFACQALDVLYIYPVVAKVLQLSVAYLIIERMTKDKASAALGVTLFILFDWTPYYMFLPPSMGLLLFMAIMLVLCVRQVGQVKERGWIILLIVFFAGSIVSHLLTTVLILGIFFAILLLEKFPIKRLRADSKDTLTPGLFILALVMMISYTVYANTKYLREALPAYLDSVGDLFRVFGSAGEVGSGSSAYSEVIIYKVVFTGIIAVVLLVAFIFLLRKNRNFRDFHYIFPFVVMVVGTVVPVVIFSLYSFESITRSFAYVIPFVALVVMYSRKRKVVTVIIVALMLISPVLFVASAYGNMSKDFVSRDEVIGTIFFYDHTEGEKVLIYGYHERVNLIDRINEWRFRNIKIISGNANWENGIYPSCVVISNRSIETAFYSGQSADVAGTYNVLYANPGARVYDSPTYKLFWTGQWNTTAPV